MNELYITYLTNKMASVLNFCLILTQFNAKIRQVDAFKSSVYLESLV